jgi:hypothetical protein
MRARSARGRMARIDSPSVDIGETAGKYVSVAF